MKTNDTDDAASAFALLARIREAVGDDGKRMQDELIEYLRQMRVDAERWQKCKRMRKSWWLEAIAEAGTKSGRSLDEQIDEQPDAAIDEK